MITTDGWAVEVDSRSELLPAAGFFSVLAMWWLATAVCLASIAPPSTDATAWKAFAATAIAMCLTVHVWRQPWWAPTAWRLALPGLAASTAALTAITFFFAPVGWANLLGSAFVYLVFLPACAVVGVVALVTADRRPLRAATVVGFVLLFVAVLRLGDGPLQDAGLRFRIDRVSPIYEAEAAPLLASGVPSGPDASGRLVAQAQDGQVVVAWKWVEAIPARSYGPVYDPAGALGDRSLLFRAGGAYEWNTSSCQPITGPWLWCQIY